MAARKAPLYSVIVHETNTPPVIQAANIALLTLKAARRNTWDALGADEASYAHVILSAEQQQLLAEYHDILGLLSLAPLRTLYACEACGRSALTDGSNASKKCNLTFGCTGETVKAAHTVPRTASTVTAAK